MRSVSQRLLFGLTLLMLIFFGVMIAVLEDRFRKTADRSQNELLQAQMAALISSAELDDDGYLLPRLPESEDRLRQPTSGMYAAVSDAGDAFWRSPSATGKVTEFGPALSEGERQFHELKTLDGARLAAFSRGISWELEHGDVRSLTFTVATDQSTYEAELRTFRRGLRGGFIGVALLLLLGLAGLTRWALAPLRRMARQIRAVEQGEREQLDGRWPSELTGVVANLNTLLTAERTRIARYRDTLGNLAHSLKTPLAVLRAAVTSDNPAAGVVNQQVERMSAIVEHQLRRAATSGGTSVAKQAEVVLPIVQDLRSALLKAHARKDFSLEVSIPPTLLFVGDRDDLTEALGNLMDNAAKWCRGQVRVTGSLLPHAGAAQKLSIVVEDDGPGIAVADRARVLERGARADEHTPGHGLGLAMVREMAGLYGGSLEISASPLGGARIGLLLPGRSR
ncbi:MAG TPA: ATP-binding protein [Steroidobacteraceae bacterium]|nr:ATP-binding protein [Steroidobacteraceae bacterium]